MVMYRYPPESKPLEGFTIKRAIQRGGFGEVYFALTDGGKEVALKLLHSNLDIELRGVSQCLNLKHPNLLTIFDVKQDSIGDQWVVMEYMAGQTLQEVLTAHPQGLPIEQVNGLLAGMVAGVTYLHDQGLVHRDLKPANVYVEHGHIKIGDVGLSKFISTSQRSGHTESIGTVYYMAPEIAHGRYGREIDVYALGVMLFELLSGKVPFDGETTGEILMKQLTQPPDLSKLPKHLQSVLERVLRKDPAQRTPSAQALLDDFRAALNGRSIPVAIATNEVIPVAELASAPKSKPQPVPVFVQPDDPQPSPTRGREVVRLRQAKQQEQVIPADECFEDEDNIEPASPAPAESLVGPVLGGAVSFLILLVLVKYALAQQSSGAGDVHFVRLASMPFAMVTIWAFVQVSLIGFRRWHRSAAKRTPISHRARRTNDEYHRYRGPETRRLTWLDRLTELSSSMTVSALCAGLVSLALWWLNAFVVSPTQAVFFAVGTTLGSWAALIPSKLWEGRADNGVARRLTTMFCGTSVGVALFALSDFLHMDLPIHCAEHIAQTWSSQANFSNQAAMSLQGYVAFFSTLLVARRWWFHVDAFRDRRLSVLSVIATGLAGLGLGAVTQFPTEWALMWGLTTSTTAQLAAVWIPNESRYES